MNGSFDDISNNEFDEEGLQERDYPRASFLVALLLHYPELARVRVRPQEGLLTLSFLLQTPLEPAVFKTLSEAATGRLNLLSYVEGQNMTRVVHVSQRKEGSLAVLELDRDLHTLTAEEFPILFDLVINTAGSLLLVDATEGAVPVSPRDDDLSITDVLNSTEIPLSDVEIIGVRDSGRVLVFRQG